jgi:hypothetical protein
LVATLLQPTDCVNGSGQEVACACRDGAPAVVLAAQAEQESTGKHRAERWAVAQP